MTAGEHTKIVVNDPSEIPEFATEAEEHEFWQTHRMGDGMFENVDPLEEGELPPVRPRTHPVPIRFDGTTLDRLKALAARRGVGYQTLLKEFVIERLYEEEKREGLIVPAGPGPGKATVRRVRQFTPRAAARRSGVPGTAASRAKRR